MPTKKQIRLTLTGDSKARRSRIGSKLKTGGSSVGADSRKDSVASELVAEGSGTSTAVFFRKRLANVFD